MEKRTKEIKIRLTEREHDLLLERCEQSQLASWLRALGLGERRPRQRKLPTVDPVLLRQISGMGNNLNQIARLLHQSPSFSSSERVQLLAVLTSMDHQLSALLAEYRCDDC